MRILIDLDEKTLQRLERMAKSENRVRKNYIETKLTELSRS